VSWLLSFYYYYYYCTDCCWTEPILLLYTCRDLSQDCVHLLSGYQWRSHHCSVKYCCAHISARHWITKALFIHSLMVWQQNVFSLCGIARVVKVIGFTVCHFAFFAYEAFHSVLLRLLVGCHSMHSMPVKKPAAAVHKGFPRGYGLEKIWKSRSWLNRNWK